MLMLGEGFYYFVLHKLFVYSKLMQLGLIE